MKIRHDYVTNSSSSSFIISRDKISEEKLFELLIELSNKTQWVLDQEDEYKYTKEDFKYDLDNDCIYISNFNVRVATENKPYHYEDEWMYLPKYNDINEYYTNHYVIDNDTCGRYDWATVEAVLCKYGLDLIYGYCD